ncbi:hypothetical protein [Mesobacillus harenae]|uniref:hypothetical protein n=1 Tax=Mesobacillus harenae TaxID=2213203 RepID=UPI0015808CA6|nr:hypothetical protein [Mesobacillus harenae]
MGYIIPFTHYQYSQYAEREAGNDSGLLPVSPVSKIQKERPVQKGNDQTGQVDEKKRHSHTSVMLSKRSVDNNIIEKVYAEITGKGKHFSEII